MKLEWRRSRGPGHDRRRARHIPGVDQHRETRSSLRRRIGTRAKRDKTTGKASSGSA